MDETRELIERARAVLAEAGRLWRVARRAEAGAHASGSDPGAKVAEIDGLLYRTRAALARAEALRRGRPYNDGSRLPPRDCDRRAGPT